MGKLKVREGPLGKQAPDFQDLERLYPDALHRPAHLTPHVTPAPVSGAGLPWGGSCPRLMGEATWAGAAIGTYPSSGLFERPLLL